MDLTNINRDRKNRRKNEIDLNTLVFGKIPPQAVEMESAVLGALMLEKSAFEQVSDILTEESFYTDANQRVFKAMTALAKENQPIDLLTVVQKLKTFEELELVGGAFYVAKLTNSVVSGANIEYHSKVLAHLGQRRALIKLGGITVNAAYDDTQDTKTIMEDFDREFTRIQTVGQRSTIATSESLGVEVLARLNHLRTLPDHITGVPSGFNSLDKLTHGWQDGELIVLAARPGMGKTALALKLARSAANNPHKAGPVLFFSLEMGNVTLMQRMLSAESGVDLSKMVSGRLSHEEMDRIAKATATLGKFPLFFDETSGLTVMQMKAKARKVKRKSGLRMIVLDYIQLMNGDGGSGNREQEISYITRNLKGLAKELQIPLIALCQLSRETEKRTDPTPKLSDLRESGAIEQDADMVAFIYRPEYYGKNEDHNGNSTSGVTLVKVAKHRNGTLDTIKLMASLAIQQFYDAEFEPSQRAVNAFKPHSLNFEKDDVF